MKHLKYILFLLPLFTVNSSCKKAFFEPKETTPKAIFDELWTKCNEQYSFFEYKNINWDSIRNVYEPLITDDMNEFQLFYTLSDMLVELKDGHVNLVSPFQVMRYEFDLTGPENYNDRLVRESYLLDYYQTGPFRHNYIAGGQVGYINYQSFGSTVSNFSMDFVMALYGETDGIIIDIRNNGGGSITNLFQIINRICPSEQLLYNSFLKDGPGMEDFGKAQPAFCKPEGDDLRYTGEVKILTDRGSFSASSFFTLAAKELPNCEVIGDTTGGGLGIPNGGQLANGWTYRFSVSRTLSVAGENFENGVPPDIVQNLDPADRDAGIDSIIERAVFEILN